MAAPATYDELRAIAEKFEQIVHDALKEKWGETLYGYFHDTYPILRMDTRKFVYAYERYGEYPAERASGALHRLIDFKLEAYFILEVDLGLQNACYFEPLEQLGRVENPTPRYLLVRLALDQNLISKSRILWERVMNLVYYLETGKEIEGRSKKKSFFSWIRGQAPRKWLFLEPYEKRIEVYDSSFRTPELHKNSILRKELLEGTTIDSQKLLELINRGIGAIWDNLMSIMAGGWPTSFTDLHLLPDENHEIDPRYLPPEQHTAG
ncbi:hypothetical protein [Amycolatopsis thermoflava]|uniref:hypothetical protein n=1 Tax=Amycolatopsis thermoflava TaxID=84480 RepID=UPI00380428A9